jgi:predicted amidophosphoribosyltransferase
MVYEDEGRALVHQLKDGGLRRLAAIGADIVEQQVPVPDVDVLTWVPADPWRTIRRGYHPPELLARELGRRWSIPCRALLAAPLRRRPQRGLSPAGRRANVRGAFRARSEVPRRVCVVDDVYTTGATLSACGSALRRRGAGEVAALTLARAVRR